MNKRRKTIQVLVAVFVAVSMMAAMALPALAQQGPEIMVTHSGEEADQPDVAIDSQGNVHIAYCDVGPSYLEMDIFYTMLDNNGNTLIDDTMISQGGEHPSRRPAIIVDSQDKVHIVWQQRDYYYDGEDDWIRMELYYTKLDPSLDDQDGDSADESAITEVDDTRLTDFGYISSDWGVAVGAPRIDIDSGDNIHIAFLAIEATGIYFSGVYYMQIDSDGNINIDVIELKDCWPWRANPDVAVDSNDNAHITWSDDEDTCGYEAYYMMLDGSTGNTLIDATLINPDDCWYSRRQSIVVDFEDNVHIIWTDWRGDLAQIYHTKLDPSLDDQDGDSASEMVITLIDDTALTPDDGHKRNLPTSAIGCGRYIHVTWYEDWGMDEGPGYLHYMILDWNGNVVSGDTALTTNKTAFTTTVWTMAYLDVDSNGKAHIVWCDERHMYMDNFDDQLGSPDGGPGRYGGSNEYTDEFRSPPGDDEGLGGSNNYTDQLGNSYGWEVYYTNYQGPSCPIVLIGPTSCIYLHCEDGLFNLTEPVDTQWHELWPFFCKQYHLSSWNDTSGNGVLSHCDWVDIYEKPDGAIKSYHVEEVTITLNLTPARNDLVGDGLGQIFLGEPMYVELEGGYDPAALTDPIGTQWHEIYPDFCTSYNLTDWDDNGNVTLDYCDYILLVEKESGNVTSWHVEDVAIDILVCREPPPVGGEAYPVSKASLLAPWIVVGIVLAGGTGWYILRRRRARG